MHHDINKSRWSHVKVDPTRHHDSKKVTRAEHLWSMGWTPMVEMLPHALLVVAVLWLENSQVRCESVDVLEASARVTAVSAMDEHKMLQSVLIVLKIQRLVAIPYAGSLNTEPGLRYELFAPEWLRFYF